MYNESQAFEISQISVELGQAIQAHKSRGYNETSGIVEKMMPYSDVFFPVLVHCIRSDDGRGFCQSCLDELITRTLSHQP